MTDPAPSILSQHLAALSELVAALSELATRFTEFGKRLNEAEARSRKSSKSPVGPVSRK